MNMHPEQDEFQQLRRLLALKRHEQPPPGYFDNFSREVILRLRERPVHSKFSLFEVLAGHSPWLERFLAGIQSRPILAGGFGFTACGLLVAGLLFSEPGSSPELPLATVFASQVPMPGSAAVEPIGYYQSPQAPPASDVIRGPQAQPSDSLFQQLKELPMRAQLLGTSPPGLAQ